MTRGQLIEFKDDVFRRIEGATMAMTDLPSIGPNDFMALAALCQVHRAAVDEINLLPKPTRVQELRDAIKAALYALEPDDDFEPPTAAALLCAQQRLEFALENGGES